VDVAAVRLFVMAVAGRANQRQASVVYLIEEKRTASSAHICAAGSA
jgi:hypothetical protein